jgi:hypothetical protein
MRYQLNFLESLIEVNHVQKYNLKKRLQGHGHDHDVKVAIYNKGRNQEIHGSKV